MNGKKKLNVLHITLLQHKFLYNGHYLETMDKYWVNFATKWGQKIWWKHWQCFLQLKINKWWQKTDFRLAILGELSALIHTHTHSPNPFLRSLFEETEVVSRSSVAELRRFACSFQISISMKVNTRINFSYCMKKVFFPKQRNEWMSWDFFS